ncbi:unnamed protein product [Tetraodon nigroviridis]|uniref:Chromosome undetermined SCAF10518, whole genome shotgun sequence n=1 Tax=Tetraodon nigroviridis TaxID=99883 RepID=Q4T1P5_TETNG|nr:unnamed protein product [Tetraodon nigroviridis]
MRCCYFEQNGCETTVNESSLNAYHDCPLRCLDSHRMYVPGVVFHFAFAVDSPRLVVQLTT